MTDDLLTLAELADAPASKSAPCEAGWRRVWFPAPKMSDEMRATRRTPCLRALAARAMREIYGMTLAEIRQDLLTADAARVEAYAAMAAPSAGRVAVAPSLRARPRWHERGRLSAQPAQERAPSAKARLPPPPARPVPRASARRAAQSGPRPGAGSRASPGSPRRWSASPDRARPAVNRAATSAFTSHHA